MEANLLFAQAIEDSLCENREFEAEVLGKTIGFSADINVEGKGHFGTTVKGLAFKISKKVKAVINEPVGVFDVHVYTSAGTDATFHNVKTGQQLECKVSIKKMTEVSIDIMSSVPNVTLKGELFL